MFLIYMLFFFGFAFGILLIAELAVILYKIFRQTGSVKTNAILAVIFAIVALFFASSAVFVVLEKIARSNIALSDVSRSVGEKSAEVSANAFKGFVDSWNNIVPPATTENAE